MESKEFIDKIVKLVANSKDNYVSAEDAIHPGLVGMKIYEEPLVRFACADDELFTEFKKEGIIHPEYQTPLEWLPGAKTVISFFLPFTKEIKKSNRNKTDGPYEPGIPQRCSPEWLHGRIEGQIFLDRITDYIQSILEREGFETICPTTSGRLRMITPYISTWSERHAAYAAGLGTFGLSKGLITPKGMAGRFGSVITNAEFSPNIRPYSKPFEYCTMCGACMMKCPVGAIDKARGCALGKDQLICGPYVSGGKLPPFGPNKRVRYGCGKCQSGVPCESGIPQMKNEKVYTMSFAKVYPLLVNKTVKKGRTADEVDKVIEWLTGYDSDGLKAALDAEVSYEVFFAEAPKLNPDRKKITGTICGVRVENIEEPLMQEIRYLDKLVDELAKGKSLEKIFRK